MPIGYTQPLYILPFDHRASFVSGMFGWRGALKPEQIAQITAAKRVIYDGFTAAVAGGVDKDKAGILSEILTIFANCGANILTINQSIPTGGKAMVTISAETGALNCPIEELTHVLAETRGVVRAEAVAG